MLLEYNLAHAIHQVTRKQINSIAYLTGNREAFGLDIIAAFSALEQSYHLDTFNLQANEAIPVRYEALIINRPLQAFSEVDKFKIDQYLMHGGSVFWNIDAVSGTLDSLQQTGTFNAMPIDLNLNDMLFRYGLRVNGNLMEDAVKCAGIPLMASGNNGQPVLYPWVYFPVLQSGSGHPIVKNLDGVLGRFVSTIDLNSSDPSIKKTVLLTSSDYSKTSSTPTPIILESAMVEPNPATFRDKNLIAAVLLEGAFPSAYSDHKPKSVLDFMDTASVPFLQKAVKPTKMIVAADGELMMNEVSQKGAPSDLGVYRFSDYRFDNKSFLLNCMEYLTDPDKLLEARSKTYKTRLLDPKRVSAERSTWQVINLGIPAALILILGAIFFFFRKRKYW
jgi:gliding-associated putative ABC transporter substrate-binding component GldG